MKKITILILLIISTVALGCSMDTNYITVGEASDSMDAVLEEHQVSLYINDFSVQPACDGNTVAVNFTYDLKQVPDVLELQVAAVEEYETFQKIDPVKKGSSLYGICEICAFFPEREYTIRLRAVIDGNTDVSQSLSINTSAGSKYRNTRCP